MNNKIVIPLGIIAAAAVVIILLFVSKPKPTPAPVDNTPVHVKVAVTEAKQQSLSMTVVTQGTVKPKREINLIAQVSGQVVSVEPSFDNGGFFEPDQLLIQIDDREYQAALLAAQARVAEAEYRLAEERGLSRQAKREWRDLGNQNANDLFLRKPQLASAQANLDSARGALTVAELNVQRTQITVPFKGRIKEKFVDLGQYVSIGTSLATVYDSTIVELRLPLTEQQAALVNLPFRATTADQPPQDLPKVAIRGSVAGQPHQWEGVLARTDAFIDEDSRMYYAVVEVANPFQPQGKNFAPLLPGLFVEAEIEGKIIERVMEFPRSALFQRDKIVHLDADNVVVVQKVKVLKRSSDSIWVQAELEEKTLVTTEKQAVTPAGTTVEPLLNTALTDQPIVTAAPISPPQPSAGRAPNAVDDTVEGE